MSLQDSQPGQIADRCEECGAKLTEAEQQAVLESGGPALCTVHAAEALALLDEDDELVE